MSVLQGDTLIGKHPLDLLSRASNAELASIGNYGTGAYARFYHSNDANQGSIFGINDAGDLFGSNIAGGVSRLRIDQVQIGSIASTDNATSNLAFNNVNLTGLCNVQIIGSLLDKDGNPYSLSGGSGSGGFADYAVYLPYNPDSQPVRVIQTNDATLANRVLFSLTLPAGRYYLNGVIPYTNLDSLVPINSTNWASANVYNGTLAMYTGSTATLVQATPFFSTTTAIGATQYLSFTVFVDALLDSPTAQNFVIAVEGTGHRLSFTLADVTVKGIPVQTSTGLGTSEGDSILVSRPIPVAPIRAVQTIPVGETSNTFNVTTAGNFRASASNTEVYLNGTKYVYQDAANYDYSVVYNYNTISNTTTFTVGLAGEARGGDVVDIVVWPEAYTSNYFVSGKFYQATTVTSSPWQKVISSVPSIRYPGNLIVDGTIFLGGDIYGGCNVRDFTSGIDFDSRLLSTLSCNIIGTLNLANYSVTPAKLNLTGGNVGVGTTIPVQTLDVRGSIRLDGAMYDASNNPIWLPSSSIQWNASPTPPTFTMPGGAVLSYGRSNGVYRWVGDDFAYNINVAATVATAPSGPLTPAGSNYLLTLPYPVLSASYPTATIIGDLWLTTTNPTEGAGTSNMFKAYAATIPTNANAATIRALTGTTDESLAVLSVGTQFTLQGTLVYRTTSINQSFTVPALYTQSSVIQDQNGNLGINLPPPTMPRGGFDIYSSNAVIPALVVDQRSTGDIVSLREGGVTVVTVDGNGNVGIGTTTPVAPLHVFGNTKMEGNLTLEGAQTVSRIDITNNSSNTALKVNQVGNADIVDLQDNGVTDLCIKKGGNVGIGTNAPTAMLHVAGTVYFPELRFSKLPNDTGGGNYHFMMAIRGDGELMSWGRGFLGQLGLGTNYPDPVLLPRRVPLPFGKKVAQVTVSSYNGVSALTTDGSLYSWGRNSEGAVGDGTTVDRSYPVLIPTVGTVTKIYRTSQSRARGSTFYINSVGDIYRWGELLGLSTFTSPTVMARPANGAMWKDFSASITSAWAWTEDSDGNKLYAIGQNTYGQLGDGSTTTRTTWVAVLKTDNTQLTNIKSVKWTFEYDGTGTAYFLLNNGDLYACGHNVYGECGIGNTTNQTKAAFVISDVRDVNPCGGFAGTVSIVKNDGTLWAWGFNSVGQVGDGTTTSPRTSPIQIRENGTSGNFITGVRSVHGGMGHEDASLYFIKEDGSVYVTGYYGNTSSPFGVGFNGHLTTYTQVLLSEPIENIYAAYYYADPTASTVYPTTYYLARSGRLYACGYNGYGQCGNGNTTNINACCQILLG